VRGLRCFPRKGKHVSRCYKTGHEPLPAVKRGRYSDVFRRPDPGYLGVRRSQNGDVCSILLNQAAVLGSLYCCYLRRRRGPLYT